ncbi:MAG TPA: YihY/virulence factor BrkB family protein [Stellaceae bacterium]|nr:YihY/virulence factor BrkB family protein [Stellaceae bacterium]
MAWRIGAMLAAVKRLPAATLTAARQVIDLFRAATMSWLGDRAPSMGAAIAYYTVFSLAPVLILVIAVAGLVYGKRAAEGALFDQIAALVGKDSAGAVQALLRSASGTKSGIIATLIGFAALILAATGVFGEIQSAFNVIWKAKSRGASVLGLVKTRLRSLSLIVAIGFLLLLSLAASTALTAFTGYLSGVLPGLPAALDVANLALSFAVTTALFAMMYKMLPDVPVRWEDVWIGAAVAALLFTAGKHAISLYIGTSGVSSVYHAVGAVVLLLVWIYYSAQIMLFGAELAKAFGDQRQAARNRAAASTPSEPS